MQTALSASNQDVERLSNELAAAQRALADTDSRARAAREQLSNLQEAERKADMEYQSTRRNLDWQVTQLEQLQNEMQEAASQRDALTGSQEEIEDKTGGALTQLQEIRGKLSGMQLEEFQQQAAYWTTRAAVAEQSVNGVDHRLEERRRNVVLAGGAPIADGGTCPGNPGSPG